MRLFSQCHHLSVSWSRLTVLRSKLKCRPVTNITSGLHLTANHRTNAYNQWTQPITFNEPEFNLDYLLDPRNRDRIRQNIIDRKGVGNIDCVVELWEKWKTEQNAQMKEELHRQFLTAAADVPNQSHPMSPIGEESNARMVDLVGYPRECVEDGVSLKSIVELGEELNMLRTKNVAITTGNTSYYFTGQFAQLEHALIRYTVNHLLNQGFELVSVPDLLEPEVVEGCGFRTSGDVTQVYKLDSSRHRPLCLAGTAEMSLAGLFTNEVLKKEDLPKKVAAVSRCYRAETSNAESNLGIYRVHQFTKVEMFGVTHSDTGSEGDSLLEELIAIETQLFSQLGLHFRVLDMPTAELGAPAYRKLDIEALMPATQFWGEISSASNCTDFQSRRLNLKYRTSNGDLKHCTTVNGTACAVPRTIIAVCETHQNKDGNITIPECLREYMGGAELIQQSDNIPKMSWIKSNKL